MSCVTSRPGAWRSVDEVDVVGQRLLRRRMDGTNRHVCASAGAPDVRRNREPPAARAPAHSALAPAHSLARAFDAWLVVRATVTARHPRNSHSRRRRPCGRLVEHHVHHLAAVDRRQRQADVALQRAVGGDHHQDLAHVRRQHARLRSRQQRRRVEDDDAVRVMRGEIAQQLRHLLARQQFRRAAMHGTGGQDRQVRDVRAHQRVADAEPVVGREGRAGPATAACRARAAVRAARRRRRPAAPWCRAPWQGSSRG